MLKHPKLLNKASSPCVIAVLYYALAAPAAAIPHCVWTARASQSLHHWPRGERIAPAANTGSQTWLRGGSEENATVEDVTRSSIQDTEEDLYLRAFGWETVEEGKVPSIIDLTGDRGVLKLTTRSGIEGLRPAETDEVYLLFNGSIECLDNHSHFFNGKNISGVQFDSTSVGSGATLPRCFQVGSGNTLLGWDLVVRNMTKGERATVLVRSDFGYGNIGRTTRGGVFIPPNSTLRFQLELLRWNEKDLHIDGGVVVSYSKTPEEQRPDSDNRPEPHDQVLLRYTGRYNKRIFLSSGDSPVWVSLSDAPWTRLPPTPHGGPALALPPTTLPRGVHDVLKHEAIKGGHYNMTLTSAYAYGAEGLVGEGGETIVPSNASVEFEIELFDWNTLTDRFLDASLSCLALSYYCMRPYSTSV
jgi:FKBP-type peptidyl-prolyl cis-trans isomerase